MPEERATLKIEEAQILFRNFEGREGKFNQKGERSFCVLLDEETAKMLSADDWNVKELKPDEDGNPGDPYLPVEVSYKHKPPKIYLITNGNRTLLDEDTCEIVDLVDIKFVDLIVNPFTWGPINGKSGVKAYLKTMFVVVEEDELERKYADLEDLPTSSGRIIE